LSGEISAIVEDLAAGRTLSEQSLPRLVELARRFEGFAVFGVGLPRSAS